MKTLLRPAAVAAVIAAVVNAVVFLIGTAVSGPMSVEMPQHMDIALPQVVGSTLMFSVLGSLVVALIALRTRQPRRTWVLLTVVGLVLYGVMPFVATPSVATALWFNVMHAVAGLVVIPAVATVLPETK